MYIFHVTVKIYQALFGVSKRTAERMMKEDKAALNVKRVNTRQLLCRHGLLESDIVKYVENP